MSSKSGRRRKHAKQSVHRFYKHDDAGLDGACVYCGMRATSEDHVPPLSVASDLTIEGLKGMAPKLFPACLSCNSVLGDTRELLLIDRRDIIANYLQTKRKRMLARGREIFEQKLPFVDDLREAVCLQTYERWLFASVTVNEATPDPEPEEEYTREDFSNQKEKLTKAATSNQKNTAKLRSKTLPSIIQLSDLAFVDLNSISEADLKKSVSDFVNLADAEIENALLSVKQLSVSSARDHCIKSVAPFLKARKDNAFSLLTSDDGVTYFLAVVFSRNCGVETRRAILSELKRKTLD